MESSTSSDPAKTPSIPAQPVFWSNFDDPLGASSPFSGAQRTRRTSKTSSLAIDMSAAASAKLARRRSTLGTLSNASNENIDLRRGSIGTLSSLASNLDLLTALQQTPSTLLTDHRGHMDLRSALMVSPEDVLAPRTPTSRRTSTVSLSSNASGPSVDMLQALRAGPSLAHRRATAPALQLVGMSPNAAPLPTPRSSISSQSGPASSSGNTAAPLLDGTNQRRQSTPYDVLSIRSQPRTDAQAEAASAAFAALRRKVTGSRSEIATQLIEELAAAAAEHACAPASSTARELDQVAQEVADSYTVGAALTAALAHGGYPPLALCTPSDAARLWRDLKGVDLVPSHAPLMEKSDSHESGRSEELLDEGRKRWLHWQASQPVLC